MSGGEKDFQQMRQRTSAARNGRTEQLPVSQEMGRTRPGRQKYAACAAVCGGMLLAWCVLEVVLKPYTYRLLQVEFDPMPEVWYYLTVPAIAAMAAGCLVPSLLALRFRLRLPSRRMRTAALVLAALLLAAYLVFVLYFLDIALDFLEHVPGFVPWVKTIYQHRILRLVPLFLSGCLLFLGLNR